ncbi:hypothetical protein D9M69_353800 [compost metagenome]
MQVDLFGAALGGQLGHGDQVVLVAVHAAFGEQAHEVHGLAGGHGLVHGFDYHRVGEEVAVADRLGHAGEVLVNDAAGAEVHVADFGVAHLAVRQADIHAAAGNQAIGQGRAQAVVDRGLCGVNGIVLGAVTVTETVQDDQDQGFGRGCHKVRLVCAKGWK